MKKKILLAAAAMTFGMSLNVSALSSECSRVCSAAYQSCYVHYSERLCNMLTARCDACIGGR